MTVKLIPLLLAATLALPVLAESAEPTAPAAYDAELAKKAGANENGMRSYVLVILKTKQKLPDGPERDEMFKGHFANMLRLSKEGKLALAGPLDGVQGRRGIFVLMVPDIEAAKQLVATDPVIIKGEMEAEYHKLFASAAVALIPDLHNKLMKKPLF